MRFEGGVLIPETAEEWNGGCCDLVAVGLHRLYGLPLMGGFELLADGSTGFLCHAFCRLPDGRMIDAAGPAPMLRDDECASEGDDVAGGIVIELTGEDDPRLTEVREFDYDVDLPAFGVEDWILEHLDPVLREIGVHRVSGTSPAP